MRARLNRADLTASPLAGNKTRSGSRERFVDDGALFRIGLHDELGQFHREHGGVLGLDAACLVPRDPDHVIRNSRFLDSLSSVRPFPDAAILVPDAPVGVIDVPGRARSYSACGLSD